MLDAFLALAEWQNLLFLAIGTGLGIVVGAIPGLTASMLIALTLPLTFHMDPVSAVTLLIGEYVGGISGGLITAIMLKMPGTPSAVMTVLDGHPMAQQGRAGPGRRPLMLSSQHLRLETRKMHVFRGARIEYYALSPGASTKSCVHRAPTYWRSFEAQHKIPELSTLKRGNYFYL